MRLSFWKICLICSPVVATTEVVKLQASAHLPVGASKPVEHAFASFSFPVHFFADFAGNKSHPNRFSQDVVRLLHEKTGAWPHIRVGGTSGDRAIYNASQTQSIILSEELDNGIPLEVYLGPTWFEGFETFPTPWTFGVNLANNKSNALDNALAEAEAALKHIKGNLVAFEIGNEPDLYPGSVRPLNFTEADYVREWRYFADAISQRVMKGNKYGLDWWKIFQALTFVDGWSVSKAFDEYGIDSTGHVKLVSQHQYAAGNADWVRLGRSFMNHTAIAANLTQYIPAMEALQAYDPQIPFLLGETNSDYVNLNMAGVEGVFGSSLWLVDYLLFGMSLNITRFNLIQGTTFGYTAWVPVQYNGQDPKVKPPLYGQLVVADVIGHHRTVQVKSLDLGRDNLSAYAIYESDILAKYVVVNLDEWNSTTVYPRPSQQISLDVPGYVNTAEAKRLTGPGASADTGISWGGLSWNYTDGRLARSGSDRCDILRVSHGRLAVELPSSEAVVVEFHHQ
ncbi:hypothetical protein N7448_009714 [Penicillium atrosanguineum]|uniref:Beta-glucuronidase C-terminal domain-containing protein n=1 Tax=Penicillium atrosanguineum TaxID=1132637 RepID=A0A9W9Q2F5_9EURO|nr:uncharacterized protein N7443_006964 [Penicillium atrosanguineum]KAJ5123617.1 hypothetical protein N7448_009714 [Penicillium atrosanguineum]KAJ5142245.1 hypothetical protein N7526_003240 [Penicillium atrosanguineum]KAJ5298844.1 hypothetical protein N7443_006964 [Penicillium atrosanguineum]KAJ5320893.1 hypothetical protein N7476_003895 [Penicillium atrosanguineum]